MARHIISSIQDEDHYTKFLEDNKYERGTKGQNAYLDLINTDQNLFNKYTKGDRELKERNLSNNLGSNWQDIYDFDYNTGIGRYKDGYSPKDAGGLLGYLNNVDGNISSLGLNRDQFASYRKGQNFKASQGNSNSNSNSGYDYITNLNDEYESQKAELIRKREEEFNKNKGILLQQAEKAAREAYISKMKIDKNSAQENAILGYGGKNETVKDRINSDYQSKLNSIEEAKKNSIEKLEYDKNKGVNSDLSKAEKEFNSIVKKENSDRKKIFSQYNNITKDWEDNPSNSSSKKYKLMTELKKRGYNQDEIENFLETVEM
ncbi:MAG: hypothetical protein RSD67_07085 [Oscillospiraceae bacterium]